MAAYSFNVQAGAGEMAAIGVSVQVRAREGRGGVAYDRGDGGRRGVR